MAQTLTEKFLKLVQKAPQFTIQSLEPKPAYQILHVWGKTGSNDHGGISLNVLDNSTKTWSRQPVTVVNAVDPTTLASADILDDDQWIDISVPSAPVIKLRVAGAWVGNATTYSNGAGFASATDPATLTPNPVHDGDLWADTTVPAYPIIKARVSGAWVRGALEFTQAADPTIAFGANIQNGDVWNDTSVAAYPIRKVRVSAAWARGAIVFTNATDPVTSYSGNVQNGDSWYDITTAAHPILKLRVSAAWVTMATAP